MKDEGWSRSWPWHPRMGAETDAAQERAGAAPASGGPHDPRIQPLQPPLLLLLPQVSPTVGNPGLHLP